MRRILLILVTFALLVAIFLTYLRFQPKFKETASLGLDSTTMGPGKTAADGSLMGPGTGAWVKQYDRQGHLQYQFRADIYDPRPDGMVHVTRPVIEFFMGGGQILQIEGEDGIVSKPPGADRDSLAGAPVDAPRYGNLRHVTAKIFSSAADLARGQQNLTMTMTNGEFDNDTFRLFTQEYTEPDGHVVHKDEVPVTVRSKDYQFDGSGLVMFWSDLNQQLKSLDIAHGKQLTIYNASAFSLAPQSPATQPAPSVAPTPSPVPAVPTAQAAAPPMHPEAAPPAVARVDSTPAAVPAPVPQTQPQSRPRYFATFTDHVRVFQNGKQLVNADWMGVDFALKQQSEESTTEPAAPPAIAPEPSTQPAALATAVNPAPAPPTTQPLAAAPPPAATQPTQQPMLVYWDGPLHVVPTDSSTAPPLEDGKSIVHLVGAPVTVDEPGDTQQQATDIQCVDLFYRTADSGGTLRGSPDFPLIITQRREGGAASIITGQAAEFSRLNHLATIQGAGRAQLPDPNDPKSVMDAHWQQSCKVRLADSGSGQTEIESADLSGDVRVNHPRFDLSSRELTLLFDPSSPRSNGPAKTAATQQQLRQALAQGDASCTVHDPDRPPRHIIGGRLEVSTDRDEQGQLYAKTVLADDGVEADQDQQKLLADHLRIALLPKPPADRDHAANQNSDMATDAELQQLIANGNVRVSGKDSSSAQGDFLQLDKVNGHSRVSIRGSPAIVANKDSTLVGPDIRVWPDQKISQVVGPGTLDTSQQPTDPAAKPRPLHVTWSQNAILDGATNQVLITRDVVATSSPPDGPTDRAQGGRLLLSLADTPSATQASDKTPQTPTSRPEDDIGGSDFNFMRNKQVQSFSFLDNAQLDSTLTDAQGNKLRELNLRAGRIDYDNAVQKLTVPGPGVMLTYQRHAATAATQPSGFGGDGITRFDWQTNFIFDQSARTATIAGGVVIQHRDEGKDARQVRLDAPLVQATFEPQGATRPAQATDQANMQLRQMTATGGVTVTTIDKTITAGNVQYDAQHDLMICRGGQQGKVHLIDDLHPAGAFADEVWLNVSANSIEKIVNPSANGR
jgi:hypothetical protein